MAAALAALAPTDNIHIFLVKRFDFAPRCTRISKRQSTAPRLPISENDVPSARARLGAGRSSGANVD